ncbi:MAG: alcohol dehydrogenase catalytic domain-containing protein [Magnetococcus sp. DMHC-6]
MRSVVLNGTPQWQSAWPIPIAGANDALVRIVLAGICRTDLEMMRGYKGFTGIIGHEFVGVVVSAHAHPHLEGQRVVGEINQGCGKCRFCLCRQENHCPSRRVLGIHNWDGVLAEYAVVPVANLHLVPGEVSDQEAVFVEPLAAAIEILEQLHVRPTHRVLVIGDGRLGGLVAQVLTLTGCELLLIGRHEAKLSRLAALGIPVALTTDDLYPLIIDCTGSPSGVTLAHQLVEPRGKIILKSTFHGDNPLSLTHMVVNEITLSGSRCGPFAPALRLLSKKLIQVVPFIDGIFPLEQALEALSYAARPGVFKILVHP